MGIYETYAKCTASQAANLRYGSKIRYLRGLQGYIRMLFYIFPVLTKEEVDTINEIVEKALVRAKEDHTKEAAAAKANSGTSTEQRQYTGK